MSGLLEQRVLCPYCNEPIVLLVDTSVEYQEYIEDCQVCCRPIEITAIVNADDEVELQVRDENE